MSIITASKTREELEEMFPSIKSTEKLYRLDWRFKERGWTVCFEHRRDFDAAYQNLIDKIKEDGLLSEFEKDFWGSRLILTVADKEKIYPKWIEELALEDERAKNGMEKCE